MTASSIILHWTNPIIDKYWTLQAYKDWLPTSNNVAYIIKDPQTTTEIFRLFIFGCDYGPYLSVDDAKIECKTRLQSIISDVAYDNFK